MNMDLYFTPDTQIYTKLVKDLNVIAKKNFKNLYKNKVVNLCDLGLENGFLNMTPKAQVTKETQINWTA